MKAGFLFALLALVPGCGDSRGDAGDGAGGSSGGAGSGGSSGSGGGSLDPTGMSFFVTSVGKGPDGGDYGGLDGADAFCAELAAAVGHGDRTWRAYLCTSTVDARDRIGAGPWHNQRGQRVAADVASLHAGGIQKEPENLIVDENGALVPLEEHDIVTGCNEDGTVAAGLTCQDWTSADPADMAQVGHSDIPPPPFDALTSWNSVHPSAGCDEQGLAERLGSGRIYCFIADER